MKNSSRLLEIRISTTNDPETWTLWVKRDYPNGGQVWLMKRFDRGLPLPNAVGLAIAETSGEPGGLAESGWTRQPPPL